MRGMESDVSVLGQALVRYFNALPHKTIRSLSLPREPEPARCTPPIFYPSALIEDSDRLLITGIIEITSPLA